MDGDKVSDSSTDDYFLSYENLEVHRLMLEDAPRTKAYKEAILSSKELFENKIVLDVGAGTGILSIFCAQAGAKKVYAVEASNIAKVSEEIVKENGFGDVIKVLNCCVEDLDLSEEKVDIIVSEWMGFYLLHEAMLDSVIYARDKFLKEGGHIFPEECVLYAAPCELPSFNTYWDNVYGVKMKSFGKMYRKIFEGKPEVRVVPPENLLNNGTELVRFNLSTVSKDELVRICDRRVVACSRGGLYQGICLWFSIKFPSNGNTDGDNIKNCIFSTSPFELTTHWKQTVLVLPVELEVCSGDAIAWELVLQRRADSVRMYAILFTMLDPDEESHPTPCDCLRPKCLIIKTYLAQLPDSEDESNDSNSDDEKDENNSDIKVEEVR